jgi:nucleotide-binding universal stress UspA family protein
MTPTIIAAARGEDAHDAIALATVLARVHDARVLIAGVYVLPAGQYAYGYEHAAREELRQELTRLSADIPGDVEFDITMQAATTPIAGLHELAARHDALAIVLGPSHVGGGTRAVRGDVGLELMAEAPCAVAVAPRGYEAWPHTPPAVIGVAWDDTDEAREALRTGADLARRTRGTLRIVHVLAPLSSRARREAARERLAEAAAQLPPGIAAETLLLEGGPADELARAGERVDLLVAGSRSRGAVRRVLLGSVTAGLLHRLPCPLLVVPRSAGFPRAVRGAVRSPARATAATLEP